MARQDFPNCKFGFSPQWSLWSGGGGGWHAALVCCYRLRRAAPAGRSPFAAVALDLFPPQAAVPIGLSPPRVRPLPPWPILPSLLPFPFPCPFPPWSGGEGGLGEGVPPLNHSKGALCTSIQCLADRDHDVCRPNVPPARRSVLLGLGEGLGTGPLGRAIFCAGCTAVAWPRDARAVQHKAFWSSKCGGGNRDVLIHKGGGVWRTPPPSQTTPAPKIKKFLWKNEILN